MSKKPETAVSVDEKPDVTATPAYAQGVKAFKAGRLASDNPYPSGSHDGHIGMNADRYRWYMGWYDTKLEKWHFFNGQLLPRSMKE